MAGKKLKRQIVIKKIFTKNRLVILNEDTFEEIFSLKLNIMNVFVGLTSLSIFLIAITTYIIAFTPLREYIPGYASTGLKREARANAVKSDSLQKIVNVNNAYIASIKKVLTGNLETAKFSRDSIQPATVPGAEAVNLKPTAAEMQIRQQASLEDKYNLFENAQQTAQPVLFAPVKGTVVQPYNALNKNFAVAISPAVNSPVKAVAAGTVILADWTPNSGNVLIIRHGNGLISVYKNAASLSKNQGDTVRSGEVVALTGKPDAKQGSSYLRFELWKDGYPVNPAQFINFE